MPNLPQLTDTHTLNVDQAIVGRVITGEGFAGVPSDPISSIVSHLPAPVQDEVLLTAMEQRKLNSIIQRLQRLPKLQRSILHLLFEHEGTAMTVPMMASWLSLKENTIRSRPPYDLLKMKLVTRARGRRGYKYASTVSSYLQAEFPQVDLNLLFQQIF